MFERSTLLSALSDLGGLVIWAYSGCDPVMAWPLGLASVVVSISYSFCTGCWGWERSWRRWSLWCSALIHTQLTHSHFITCYCTSEIETYFLSHKQNYNVYNGSTEKAAREASSSLNWPPKQTTEHNYEYFKKNRRTDGRTEGETNNNMCNASASANTNQ